MKANQLITANIFFTDEMYQPDAIDTSNKLSPSPSLVISRDANGKTISIYSDNTWIL